MSIKGGEAVTHDELRKLAEAATGGPWMADDKDNCGPSGEWGVGHVESGGPICWVGDPYPRGDNCPYENMQFIAAANPKTVLSLLDEIGRKDRALDRAKVAVMSLDEDALGRSKVGDWPFRDELLAEIANALTHPAEED